MRTAIKRANWLLATLPALGLAKLAPAQAQIVPALDGTGTTVTPNGNQWNIGGGQLSGNGLNLFQSFVQFGVRPGEIANFEASPMLQNILARVVGSDPSIINGLIQVSGGQPNLYLINPAGILLGPGASLNVPAAFTATTANGVGMGTAGFNAEGPNDYTSLNGNPTSLAFATNQPGAIVNAGNLAVGPGQTLNLIGGQIVNTGTLTAPGGQITLAAIPGQGLVRLTPTGSLLSFDVQTGGLVVGQPTVPAIAPLSLPQLLTAGGGGNATGVSVNSQGQVVLTGSGIGIPNTPGVTVVSGSVNAANSASGQVGGTVQVLGDRVALVDASLDASGVAGGGTVLVGGAFQGQGPILKATQTYVNQGSAIAANALHSGQGGQVIIWSDGSTQFLGDIQAQGGPLGGNGGLVEVSGQQTLNFQGTVSTAAPTGQAGTLLLDPLDILITNDDPAPQDDQLNGSITSPEGTILFADGGSATFTIGAAKLQSLTGNILLQATHDIVVDAALNLSNQVAGTTVQFQAGRNIAINQAIALGTPSSGSGNLNLQAGNQVSINNTTIDFQGNPVNARGTLTSQSGSFNSSTSDILAGNATITTTAASGPGLTTGTIRTLGGNIQLTSASSIDTTAGILITTPLISGPNVDPPLNTTNKPPLSISAVDDGVGPIPSGSAGSVTLTAAGNLATAAIVTQGVGKGQGGAVVLDAANDIQVDTINAQGGAQGGPVTITAGRFFQALGTFIDNTDQSVSISTVDQAGGGAIAIQHGGQALDTAFTVGAANPTNGTVGAISTSFTNAIVTGSFPASFTQGNIQIKTSPAPTVTVLPDPQGATPPVLNPPPASDPTPPKERFDPPDPPPTPPTLTDPTPVSLDPGVGELEERFSQEYQSLLGLTGGSLSPTVPEIQALQVEIERNTGAKPAFLYTSFVPQWVDPAKQLKAKGTERNQDELELVIVMPRNPPIRKRIAGVTRAQVLAVARQFRQDVTNPSSDAYLKSAQQLYQWLIAPVQSDLQQQGITNLVFLMDRGLRSLPVAALHDGQQFLVEQYSLGLMPSLSLTDTRYRSVKNLKLLAMGASVFQDLAPLPAVPEELALIAGRLWRGKSFLNQGFTLDNLKLQRQLTPFGIIHLATHSEFRAGSPQNSYIQLWNSQLRLDQLRQLGWNDPPVELLVLSACRTALGDEDAELGFAGSAVMAGVKSTLASLWYVSDEGTLGLMTQFYQSLETAPIKAEAMRAAQIAMLRRQISIQDGQLVQGDRRTPLPPELAGLSNSNLSHPYYWSAFTLVGNPW